MVRGVDVLGSLNVMARPRAAVLKFSWEVLLTLARLVVVAATLLLFGCGTRDRSSAPAARDESPKLKKVTTPAAPWIDANIRQPAAAKIGEEKGEANPDSIK